jgi:hypothetical protein
LAIGGIVSEVVHKVRVGSKKMKSKTSMWHQRWVVVCDNTFQQIRSTTLSVLSYEVSAHILQKFTAAICSRLIKIDNTSCISIPSFFVWKQIQMPSFVCRLSGRV